MESTPAPIMPTLPALPPRPKQPDDRSPPGEWDIFLRWTQLAYQAESIKMQHALATVQHGLLVTALEQPSRTAGIVDDVLKAWAAHTASLDKLTAAMGSAPGAPAGSASPLAHVAGLLFAAAVQRGGDVSAYAEVARAKELLRAVNDAD